MMKTILAALATVLLVQSAFPEDAEARKKKKKDDPAPTDTVVEEEGTSQDEGAAEAAGEEPAGAEGESKSITERLEGDESEGSLRSSRRLEFDERLVKGQAAKSGAVYLFKRIPRRLPGLVPLRQSYRRRIVEPVLGARALKPATYSFEVVKEKKLKKREETLEEIKEAEAAAKENGVTTEPEKAPEKAKEARELRESKEAESKDAGESRGKSKSRSKRKKHKSKSKSKSSDATVKEITY